MAQNLDQFLTTVAAEVEGSQGEPGANSALMDLLMQLIEMLLANCHSSPAVKVAASLKSPSFRQRNKFRSIVSEQCEICYLARFKPRSGAIADAMLNNAAKLSDDELTALVTEVRTPDFWVI